MPDRQSAKGLPRQKGISPLSSPADTAHYTCAPDIINHWSSRKRTCITLTSASLSLRNWGDHVCWLYLEENQTSHSLGQKVVLQIGRRHPQKLPSHRKRETGCQLPECLHFKKSGSQVLEETSWVNRQAHLAIIKMSIPLERTEK